MGNATSVSQFNIDIDIFALHTVALTAASPRPMTPNQVNQFRLEGFLPEAMINYLCLVSPPLVPLTIPGPSHLPRSLCGVGCRPVATTGPRPRLP